MPNDENLTVQKKWQILSHKKKLHVIKWYITMHGSNGTLP